MKRDKKGQMQMFETIAVMIILLLLLVFALVIYSKNKEDSIKEKGESFKDLNLVELAQIAYSLPEIQCSFAEVSDFGCIDSYKVKHLSKIINTSITSTAGYAYLYYRSIFGFSNITITEFDNNGDNTTYVLYQIYRNHTKKVPMYMPIIIYDAVTDKNKFGVMTIEKFS